MPRVRAAGTSDTPARRRAPAMNPEDREDQLIALAVGLAEKQIREGTASSQVITHFLKLGSTREQLEKERLRKENLLLEAKTQNLRDQKDSEGLYKKALEAIRSYRGEMDSGGDDYE